MKELDLKRIQQELNIKEKSIENMKIDESELKEIYRDFQINLVGLEKIRAEVLAILNDNLSGKVHSIRCRIKDADHLIEKIIRNINSKPDKYKELNTQNYNKIITDLIGVRIIILDKRDWRDVHNSLLKIFRNLPERYVNQPGDIVENYEKYKKEANEKGKELENSYHAEKPVVYITSEDDRELYKDENLEIDNSKTHYRSMHYIIRYKYVYFEIQVRTLFEEGWLEFDHRIKYPYDQGNNKKQEFASILSSLAIAADRLISFYNSADFEQKFGSCIDEGKQKTVANDSESEEQTLENKLKTLF